MPRVNDLPNFVPPDNIVVVYKSTATFDSDLMRDVFVNRVLASHKQRYNLKNSTVLLDSATCHKSARVTEAFEKNGIEVQIIPPRFTNLLQPADACWFGTIKKLLHQKWTDWYINGEKTFTKSNNMRSPGYVNKLGLGNLVQHRRGAHSS